MAFVTGGTSGIGRAITLELAVRGCHVVYHGFKSPADGLQASLESLGCEARSVRGDLRDEATVKNVVSAAAEHFGGLDILVNNAGDLVERHHLETLTPSFLRSVMDINVASTVMVARAALPHLRHAAGGAAIVNVASLAGRTGGHDGSLAYATAKGAVLTFTRALAQEVAQDAVRVNAVAPGLILGTRFHEVHTVNAAAAATVENKIPLRRAGRPEDVARAVAFLASEYDGFITGATLDINGGQYMA